MLNENSFWFPFKALPRLSVEQAIVLLASLLPTTDGLAGAEWWVPALRASQGMEWHCDCDRIVYSRDRLFVRPRISSVFYLGTIGGPTLVVDDVAADHRVRRPQIQNGGVGFLPMPNRYGLFSGDRFHAVAISEGNELRITVAINWWTAKPSAPLCIDPPYDSSIFAPLQVPLAPFKTSEHTRPAKQIQLSAKQLAEMPHRKFCPIYPRPISIEDRE
jgi:hypothetical protein